MDRICLNPLWSGLLGRPKIRLKIGKGMPKKENPKPATEKEIRAQKSPKTIISGAVSPELVVIPSDRGVRSGRKRGVRGLS